MTSLILLADGMVGEAISRWLIANYRDDIGLVVVKRDNDISAAAAQAGLRCEVFQSSAQIFEICRSRGLSFDIGILAWWPDILKPPLISLPHNGFINTHPSLLPYNRGKHYNFWAIVERAPFGVSLHMVDEGIDSGDVIFQKDIPYSWEDTGGSLHRKAAETMVDLFKEAYPRIRSLDFVRKKQGAEQGSFHLAKEIDDASRIELDKEYTARTLFNLVRARTFPGHPACTFTDGDQTFEVRIEIKRTPDE